MCSRTNAKDTLYAIDSESDDNYTQDRGRDCASVAPPRAAQFVDASGTGGIGRISKFTPDGKFVKASAGMRLRRRR